tara:strand:+ start:411 stop:878 length:468 start_codon:yes stop_codon:yes gene_type:complete
MDPKIWGPHFWYVLHITSLNYPENPSQYEKRAYYDFYTSIKDILPCKNCKNHYNTYIMQHPINPFLDKKTDLIQWVVNIHNFVNKSLDKPEISLLEMLKIYKDLKPISPFEEVNIDRIKSSLKKIKYSNCYIIIIILIIFILLSKYYYNRYYFYL